MLAPLPDEPEVTGGELEALQEDQLSAAMLEKIYKFAATHDYRIEDAEKDEMQTFKPSQLEKLLETFQRKLAEWSYGDKISRSQRFQFALRLGRHWRQGPPEA